VIVLAVRWYLRFGLSYRDVEELLSERGVEADHVMVYVAHYNRHRPHRALQLEAPDSANRPTILGGDRQGSVRRRDLLGGLLHEYRRAA
jgi:hypothetical protein